MGDSCVAMGNVRLVMFLILIGVIEVTKVHSFLVHVHASSKFRL